MNSLPLFVDILNQLGRIENQIFNLGVGYASSEARTAIDDAILDRFIAKADLLKTAAVALKSVEYVDPNP